MSTDEQPDPQYFERSRPETIGVLAGRVISVLSDRQGVSGPGVRSFVLDHLYRAILAPGKFDAVDLLEQLRGHRITVDMIIDLYVPRAAVRLGDDWVSDVIGFADVTIGSLRLQALLGEASSRVPMDCAYNQGHLQVMVIVPQGEQHFLGASVLATQLRRYGCNVFMSFDEALGMLGARLIAEGPDLILITCASEENIGSVAKTVQTIRKAMPDAPPVMLGGAIRVNPETLIERTGVDVVTSRADEALAHVAARAQSVAR